MRQRTIIGLGALVVVAIIVFVLFALPRPAEPLQAVATPTRGPARVAKVLGGQVFLASPKVVDRILETKNIKVEYISSGSFDMAKTIAENPGVYDAVWPGSSVAFNDFSEAFQSKPGFIKKSATIFRTFAIFFTWRDYIPEMEKAGLVYEQNGAYYMRMKPLIEALNQNKRWSDLAGNPKIPGLVNVITSDPEVSAGGLTFYELLASCQVPGHENCDKTVTRDELEPTIPSLLNVWDMNGYQAKGSPEAFEAFLQYGKGVPIAWSSESLYIGWRNGLPPDHKADADKVVGIYPESTISTDHVLGALTDIGVELVDAFTTDPELQQIGWSGFGMRTKVAGVDNKAGDTDVPWIASAINFIFEPKVDTANRIKEVFKGYRTQVQ